MNRLLIFMALLVAAIAGRSAQPAGADPRPVQLAEAVRHLGCCDASAGVALSSNLFIVANDEDNLLRVYRRESSGLPVQAFQAGAFLHVDPKKPESDLEGAAAIDDRIYWITSHGRNREGEARESRRRFFATQYRVDKNGRVELKAVGQPYTRLLVDFISEPRLARFNLNAASMRAPKEPGGLNIEGLCATTNRELLIAFRNPVPESHALIVPLKNPDEVIHGKRAQLGEPILLDLGGKGVRDIDWTGTRYMIIAGPTDGKGRFHLYEWDGPGAPPRKIPETHFRDMNPEALVVYPGSPPKQFQLLSDDGTRKLAGEECKKVADPRQKWFRSFWMTLP